MAQFCPAEIGMSLDEVETPALLVDLDAFEANMAAMAQQVAAAGLKLRPHAKTHKCPEIALAQMERGAVGQCCQKVAEAEALVDGSVFDVFVSNQVVGVRKLARLAALAKRARIAVCVDDVGQIPLLQAAAAAADSRLRVLVEIDVGGGRCGVAPGVAAVPLAQDVLAQPNLEFGGLQAYHGSAQHILPDQARRAAVVEAAEKTNRTLEALSAAGIDCPLVTGGGTGTYLHDIAAGPWQELQAGSYLFMDVDYGRIGQAGGDGAPSFRHSLFVLATVMSRAKKKMAVVDAGLKALAFDSGLPVVWERPGTRYGKASDEHGQIELGDGEDMPLGSRVRLVPGHCDPTINLYDWYVGFRGDRVESLWPITARGAVA